MSKKRKKRVSVTAKSLAKLREVYPYAQVVEKKVPYSFISQDLYGFADIEAFNSAETVLVQVTTQHNVNARIAKILAAPAARLWVLGEHRRIFVHGWAKKGPRGKRKLWELYTEEITEDNWHPKRKGPPPKENYEMAKIRNREA
jgi:hypothetical protein